MDVFLSPAGLVAAMCCVALAGWALGRWQGKERLLGAQVSGPDTLPAAPGGAKPKLPTLSAIAQTDLGVASDNAISLSDLHDEVTAFRRRERVFATLAPATLCLDPQSPDALNDHFRIERAGVLGCVAWEARAAAHANHGGLPHALSARQVSTLQRGPA